MTANTPAGMKTRAFIRLTTVKITWANNIGAALYLIAIKTVRTVRKTAISLNSSCAKWNSQKTQIDKTNISPIKKNKRLVAFLSIRAVETKKTTKANNIRIKIQFCKM